jgi:NADH-quinone oxidoreductase subunit C
VTAPDIRLAGHADSGAPAPATPRNLPRTGGAENPSAAALAERFPEAVLRREVIWGDTNVHIVPARARDLIQWLHDDASQQYEYLVDVTAVEHRSGGPLEVVWHVRSIAFRRFLRLKATLDKTQPLAVPSVWPVYNGADWLERECYDMFGIHFDGHPDLRRILMWEQYKEGFPLRKDFPLRGRFSRSEQLKQALASNPEAHYSMGELRIADAFHDLPAEMKVRLGHGEVTGE